MKQKTLLFWLKAMVIGMAALALAAYAIVMPACTDMIVKRYPEFSGWKTPWMAFALCTALPIAAAAALAWRIACNIGRNNSFTLENARYLKWIAYLAAVDAGFFFAGNVALLFMNMNHPGIVLGSLVPALAGMAISVAAAVLSHLAARAAELQRDSELTI